MAETTTLYASQDVTLTFKSDDGTPKTYVFKLTEGTITIEDGSFNVLLATDAQGVPLSGTSLRATSPASFCGFTIDGKLFDPGVNATEGVYADLVRNDGYVSSNWTPTVLSPDADTQVGGVWDVTIALANRVVGATTHYGAVYTFPDVRKEGGLNVSVTRDGGAMVSGHKWTSLTTVKYTAVRNT